MDYLETAKLIKEVKLTLMKLIQESNELKKLAIDYAAIDGVDAITDQRIAKVALDHWEVKYTLASVFKKARFS